MGVSLDAKEKEYVVAGKCWVSDVTVGALVLVMATFSCLEVKVMIIQMIMEMLS